MEQQMGHDKTSLNVTGYFTQVIQLTPSESAGYFFVYNNFGTLDEAVIIFRLQGTSGWVKLLN